MHVKTFGKILRLDRIHEVQGFLACHVKILKNLNMYCWKKQKIFHEEKTANCYKILNWLNKFLLVYIFARSVHNGVFVLKWLLSALISAHFQFIFCPTMSGKRCRKKIRIFRQKQQPARALGHYRLFPLISEPQTFSIEFQLKVLIDTQLKDLRKYWKNYQKCKLISL